MPEIEFAYYAWALLLICGALIAWVTNFFALPGNWFIVGLAALFAAGLAVPAEGDGLTWEAVGMLVLIAVGGELIEFLAGAAGAAKQGASRRAIALAVVGTFVGSLSGAILGLPVPVGGPLVGALLGAAAGAFVGAWLGEMWKHGGADKSLSVGVGAAIGRLLGTVGKLLVGAVMVVILAVRALSV